MGRNIKGEFQLTQRVMGVKVHGIGTFVYVCDDTVRGGANLICDILCRALNVLDWNGQLPLMNPVFYLQMTIVGRIRIKLYVLSLLIKSAKKYLPR